MKDFTPTGSRCPRCGGGMLDLPPTRGPKQQCVRCGYCPQDRPEHAKPKECRRRKGNDRR